MTTVSRDPGSFRDPSGYVFHLDQRVLRTVNSTASESFIALENCGLLDELIGRGLLIPTTRVDIDNDLRRLLCGPRGETPAVVLEHPRLQLVTYPYEWTFTQLKDAALKHLELQTVALDRGFVLSDATPYNMQFNNGRPIHVDILSLRPYREGEPWAGYNQFTRLFLVPLLLEAWSGIPFQPFLRGSIDGIDLATATALLPAWRRWLTLSGIMHITLQAKSQRVTSSDSVTVSGTPELARGRYRVLLTEMHRLIASLESARKQGTYWQQYASVNSYSDDTRNSKRQFVANFVQLEGVTSVWDLGGNSGDFSIAALDAGASFAAVLDSDLDALEYAYQQTRQRYPGMLPLVMNCVDPSPSLGWRLSERKDLSQRGRPDAIFALALIHHMTIGQNIPLREAVQWITSLARSGIIEFVPKSDIMVRQMLQSREDIFVDYGLETFRAYLGEFADITDERELSAGGRVLFSFRCN